MPASGYPPVLTKPDFVKRYKAGEFGNASPTWERPEDVDQELLKYNYLPLFHLRSRAKGGDTFYNLPLPYAYKRWLKMPNPQDYYLSEMAPHEKGLVQGEIMQTERGLYLLAVDATLPMRDAMRQRMVTHNYGLRALSILKNNLCPSSQDWLEVLLDRYPGHVIEFTSFSVAWGTLPRYNTVWWEVRKY